MPYTSELRGIRPHFECVARRLADSGYQVDIVRIGSTVKLYVFGRNGALAAILWIARHRTTVRAMDLIHYPWISDAIHACTGSTTALEKPAVILRLSR